MDSVFLNKLLLKGSDADQKIYIYLHSEWHDDVVKLYLKDSSAGLYYKGEIALHDFEEPAAELEIPLDDFRAECKAVLTSKIGMPGFELELDSEKKILKVNKNEQFCIQYLEINLIEADRSYEMLDVALNMIESGRSEDENQKTNEVMANLIQDVEKVLLEKEEWKQRMLRKFLVVLNTKKEKIAILEQKLEKMNKRIKLVQHGIAANNARESIGEEEMDQDTNEDSAGSRNDQNDFDAPTQRLTPLVIECTDTN